MTFTPTFPNAHLTRQLDVIPVEILDEPINIIGAGAVGSFTALTLAKMGFAQIAVWDDDVVSEENLNAQFFILFPIFHSGLNAFKGFYILINRFFIHNKPNGFQITFFFIT